MLAPAMCLVVLVSAQSPRLLADLDPRSGSRSSSPSELTVSGSWVYFVADDGVHGRELWRSDGTPTGARLVVDLVAGSGSVDRFRNLTPFGAGGLLFVTDLGSATVLHATDGTTTIEIGTLAIDARSGTTGTPPFPVVAGKAFFTVNGELWITDGTTAGTTVVTGAPVRSSTDPLPVVTQSRAFFTHGGALWTTDGTAGGTTSIAGPTNVTSLAAASTRVYFVTSSSGAFWESDGTPAGTRVITDALQVPLRFAQITTVGDTAYFVWTTQAMSGETNLSRSNAGAAVEFIQNFPVNTGPELVVALGTSLYVFTATSLSRVDAAMSGYLTVRALTSRVRTVTAAVGRLYFDQNFGAALWTTDGTSLGTTQLRSFSTPALFAPQVGFGGDLVFMFDDGRLGEELWRVRPPSTFDLFADVNSAPFGMSSNALGYTPFAGQTWFIATAPDAGPRLHRTDGQDAGLLTGCTPACPNVLWPQLFPLGNQLYFAGTAQGATAAGLWSTSGTTTVASSSPTGAANPRLFFSLDGGLALFANTFAPPGPMVSPNITLFAGGTWVTDVGQGELWPGLVVGGKFYFGVSNTLWVTDLTRSGTVIVDTNVLGGAFNLAAVRDGLLYLLAGGQLRRVSAATGTEAIATGTTTFRSMARLGEQVLLLSTEGELWTSDGTSAGTRLVTPLPDSVPMLIFPLEELALIVSGPLPGSPTSAHGLWATDGTAAGTTLLRSFPNYLAYVQPVGSLAFFPYSDPATGSELWRTDGTIAGTRLVADLAPGPSSSSPQSFSRVGDLVFFTATSDATGWEPWVMRIDPTPPVITSSFSGNRGDGGWFTGDVTVSFDVTDPESAIGSRAGCDPVTVTQDTADAGFTCVAFSEGGRASRTVHLTRDSTPPTLPCGEVVLEATGPAGASWVPPLLTATDNFDASPTVAFALDAGTLLPVGTTPVRATATDSAGNQSTCDVQARVRDTVAPVVTCPNNESFAPDGPKGRTTALTGASASDTVDPAPALTYTSHAGTVFQPGESVLLPLNSKTSFTVTATDASGNASTCTFDLTVACLDGLCPSFTTDRTRGQYSWSCAAVGVEPALALLMLALLRRRRR